MIYRFFAFLALLFPFPLPLTSKQKADQESLDNDTKAMIATAKWDKSTGAALDQANRIMDSEHERRKTAEGKATTYLAVLAALVPVTLSIEAAEWDHKTGPAPEWFRITILIIAVIHTAAAGWYAFRALQVRGIHVIGVYDLAKAWQSVSGQQKLAESTAQHIRASHAAINNKVTAIKVTHAHLIRAFLFFIMLLLIDPVTYQLQAIGLVGKAKIEGSSTPGGAKPTDGDIQACSRAVSGSRPLTPAPTATASPVAERVPPVIARTPHVAAMQSQVKSPPTKTETQQ